MNNENIIFNITPSQAELIKEYFNVEQPLEDYEVCELLDKMIDEIISRERSC